MRDLSGQGTRRDVLGLSMQERGATSSSPAHVVGHCRFAVSWLPFANMGVDKGPFKKTVTSKTLGTQQLLA